MRSGTGTQAYFHLLHYILKSDHCTEYTGTGPGKKKTLERRLAHGGAMDGAGHGLLTCGQDWKIKRPNNNLKL